MHETEPDEKDAPLVEEAADQPTVPDQAADVEPAEPAETEVEAGDLEAQEEVGGG